MSYLDNDGFGILFSKYDENINTNNYILEVPVYSKQFLKYERNKWQELQGDFVAEDDYDCIMVGFFEPTGLFQYEPIEKNIKYSPEIISGHSVRLHVDDIEVIEYQK